MRISDWSSDVCSSDLTLLPQPFERTAVNGFGFLQIVRRRERPSLIEQVRFDPIATDAALLLRQAERVVGAGPLQLTARPAVADAIEAHPGWIADLARRTGRPVGLVANAQMTGAGHSQERPPPAHPRPALAHAPPSCVTALLQPRMPRSRT